MWQDLVIQIKKANGLIGAQLENTYIADFKEKKIIIGVPPKVTFLFEKLSQEDFKLKLQNYLNTYWGAGYSFSVIKGEEKKSQSITPKAISEQKLRDEKNNLKKQVEEHPLVQATNKVFKTQITAIKEMNK
jgi:DNA polymerase-3 subunit gamma/tau